MTDYRRRLPPLDRLVFLEAVLRHGSFTRAAGELRVSQAAVSKQIRQLEDWLGVSLFDRGAQRLAPTATARELGDRVRAALDFLDSAVEKVRVPGDRVVQLASMNAVGMFWLQPRLKAFGLGDEACNFNLHLSDDPAALLSEDNDLAIIYGDGEIPGWTTVRLFDETLAPVASPGVAQRLCKAGLLADAEAPLLDYARRAPDWIDWAGWADRVRRTLPEDLPRRSCASYAQSVGRALDGCGVALGSTPLLADELAAGRLLRLDQPACRTERSYWLARPDAAHPSQAARNLSNALLTADQPIKPDVGRTKVD